MRSDAMLYRAATWSTSRDIWMRASASPGGISARRSRSLPVRSSASSFARSSSHHARALPCIPIADSSIGASGNTKRAGTSRYCASATRSSPGAPNPWSKITVRSGSGDRSTIRVVRPAISMRWVDKPALYVRLAITRRDREKIRDHIPPWSSLLVREVAGRDRGILVDRVLGARSVFGRRGAEQLEHVLARRRVAGIIFDRLELGLGIEID